MAQRKPFIVRVEPGGGEVTVEDVRGARVARLATLEDVGSQIARWLAPDGDGQPEPAASVAEPAADAQPTD